MSAAPTVSVVIPAYNEATYIDRLFENLTKQSLKDFEVIVSDAESKDGIDEVIKKFDGELSIKLVESQPHGPGAGRNVGAAYAKGEWLLFLDADDELGDQNFIKTLVEQAERNGWATASARFKTRGAAWHYRLGLWADYHYLTLLTHTKHPVAPGWCILTRKAVFEKYHGFNEKLQLGEDYDYVSRVASEGFGFVKTVSYFVDPRRSHAEGWRHGFKMVGHEIYRHTHNYNLENSSISYEFGKHRKRT